MVKRVTRAEALARGRDALLAARVANGPSPENPYRRGTRSHRYFDWGAERAGRLLDQIMEIGE